MLYARAAFEGGASHVAGPSRALERASARREEEDAFPTAVAWSRDGRACVAYDAAARAFERWDEGEGDADACDGAWGATSGERAYCFVVDARGETVTSSERDAPTTTRDLRTGALVASYLSYDEKDEVVAACGIGYLNDFERLACGCDGFVDVFDVSRPGRVASARVRTRTKDTAYERLGSQRGLVSCVDGCPIERDVFACGSFSGARGVIDCGVYDARDANGRVASWASGGGGVTQTKWSACGNFVFVASRKSDFISCVDVRRTGAEVYTLERRAGDTNQRIAFDIEPCGAHLVTGGVDGCLRAFDLREGVEIMPVDANTGESYRVRIADGACVNSFAFHPYASAPSGAIRRGFRSRFNAVCAVGERIFPNAFDDASDVSDADSDVERSSESVRDAFGVYFLSYPTTDIALE